MTNVRSIRDAKNIDKPQAAYRTRSEKIKGHAALARVLFKAALNLLSHTNEANIRNLKSSAELRTHLTDAYAQLAPVLAEAFDYPEMTGNDLTGLHLEMLPIQGSFKVSVDYNRLGHKRQPLNAHFSNVSGKTLQLLMIENKGTDIADEFVSKI